MTPTHIKLNKARNELDLTYSAERFNSSTDIQAMYSLPAEYLRVMSPSAEVRGHSPDQAQLQVGKKHVVLTSVEAVGHYAIKLIYDDGHDSGLYTWDYLYDLSINQQSHWQNYLAQLDKAQKSRDPHESIVQFVS